MGAADASATDASVLARGQANDRRRQALKVPYRLDESSVQSPVSASSSRTAGSPGLQPRLTAHGKAQEPSRVATRTVDRTQRVAGIYQKPWSGSCQPGHKEDETASNPYHRVWITDSAHVDKAAKWNRQTLTQHYQEKDKAFFALRPHDELHAKGTNMKFWTHLNGEGVSPGGIEKLELHPPRGTGLHLKGGLYSGKFEQVKHAQLCFRSRPATAPDWEKFPELQKDKRPMFDNRLKDDMVRANEETLRQMAQSSFDLMRPSNTRSSPQLGGTLNR